jgi:hypothetical protein
MGHKKFLGKNRRNNNEEDMIGRKSITWIPEVDRLPRVEHPLWNVFNQHVVKDINIRPVTYC